nr:MAG TPA: hypothetical protein [Caudoviricetes sp.]
MFSYGIISSILTILICLFINTSLHSLNCTISSCVKSKIKNSPQ